MPPSPASRSTCPARIAAHDRRHNANKRVRRFPGLSRGGRAQPWAGNATEHTHRPALQHLVQTLDSGVRAVNEPKRVECGAPDYIVTRNDLPVGYIEAKDVGRSLDEIERDEQLTRYRESLSNLILTDYLEFRWYKDGEKQASARIAYLGDSGKLRPDREGQAKVAATFSAFLAQEPPIVGKPEDLARRMAALARTMRDLIRKALEQDRSGRLAATRPT